MCQVRSSVVSWQRAGYAGGSFWAALGSLDQTKTGRSSLAGRELQLSAEQLVQVMNERKCPSNNHGLG
jgi:hypothetical protein